MFDRIMSSPPVHPHPPHFRSRLAVAAVVAVASLSGALGISCRADDPEPLLAFREPALERGSVWLDMDPAIGEPLRDPDDGWAFVHARATLGARLVGISVGYGNIADLDRQQQITDEMQALFPSPPLPVHHGAERAEDLERETAASSAIAEQLLESGVPLTLAPTHLALTVVIEKADLDSLDRRGGASRYLAQRSRDWLDLWTAVLGARGFSPFDALATFLVASPEKVTCEMLPAAIVDLPDRSFRGTGKDTPRVVVSRMLASSRLVKFCNASSADAKSELLAALPGGP